MTERDDTAADAAAPSAPEGIDIEKPSAARMYDWFLGGSQNWAVDREFGRRVVEIWPQIRPVAQQNRAFMNRAVKAALDAGIRQFVDLGSGVPTVGNVHDIIRDHLAEGDVATVAYVDYEPVATAHGTIILEQDDVTDWAGIVKQDMRYPDAVFGDEVTDGLIDLDQPVCVLMIAVLHFVGPDDGPDDLVREYRDRLATGSWLAITHATDEGVPEPGASAARQVIAAYRNTSNPMWLRNRAELESWFGDWTMVEPGVTRATDWRPDRELNEVEAQARPYQWAGVAEKP
jgi:O-methyltransferase involved in polyketide biosynthesis